MHTTTAVDRLLSKALHIRKLFDWAPLIIISALGGDYLHLALILATAISGFNILLDAIFRWWHLIKVWPKYLDVCFLIAFGVTLILAYTIPDTFVRRWLQVITMGGITVLVALGLCVGHPFTTDIAKENVPEDRWAYSSFRRTNVLLTGLWVLIFLIMTVSYVIVAAVHANGHHDNGVFIAFNYVVPLGFLFAGLLFSKWYPWHVRQKQSGLSTAQNSTPSPSQDTQPQTAISPKTSADVYRNSALYSSTRV